MRMWQNENDPTSWTPCPVISSGILLDKVHEVLYKYKLKFRGRLKLRTTFGNLSLSSSGFSHFFLIDLNFGHHNSKAGGIPDSLQWHPHNLNGWRVLRMKKMPMQQLRRRAAGSWLCLTCAATGRRTGKAESQQFGAGLETFSFQLVLSHCIPVTFWKVGLKILHQVQASWWNFLPVYGFMYWTVGKPMSSMDVAFLAQEIGNYDAQFLISLFPWSSSLFFIKLSSALKLICYQNAGKWWPHFWLCLVGLSRRTAGHSSGTYGAC